MRAGFLIRRKSYYRLLGPVAERALERGWEVLCFHDVGQPRRGPKAADFSDAAPAFRHGRPKVLEFRGDADLAMRLLAARPDVMVALEGPSDAVSTDRVRWLGLQYTLDLAQLITCSGTTRCDVLALHSAHWMARAAEVLRIYAFNRARATGGVPEPVDVERVAATLRERAAIVGIPEMDQCHGIHPDDVRRRLGLGAGRPVVLYIPFEFRSFPRSFWTRHVYGAPSRIYQRLAVGLTGRHQYRSHVAHGFNDRNVVKTIRAFCDANGAALVVKARAKDPARAYVTRYADRVLGDEGYYPATILELLRISSLCLHFYSTVAYEAAYAGVPSICIAPAEDDLGFPAIWQEWFLNPAPGGSFNFPGVVYRVELGRFLGTFVGARLSDYPLEPAARAHYIERFVGFDDGKASDRLLDVAQSLVEGKAVAG